MAKKKKKKKAKKKEFPVAAPAKIAEKSGAGNQDERILNILGVDDEDDAEVSDENLKKYFEFLKENLELPCLVIGIGEQGCFRWEEYYTFGPGNEKEYEKLKKKYASSEDEYEILRIGSNHEEWNYDEEDGILVDVKRLSDNKKFTLTLTDLEVVDEKSKNANMLDDHAFWFANF